jgi:predicted amidohydrolase YtcJ
MQPQFDASWGAPGGLYTQRLGAARAASMNRIATARRDGVLVAGGSDSPVCRLSALEGMHAACAHHVPGERLSAADALTLYTFAGARLSAAQPCTGALHAGFDADFTVLDRDPLGDGGFASARVLQTWRLGRLVFDRNDPGSNFVFEPGR